jgi:hypothetical protein
VALCHALTGPATPVDRDERAMHVVGGARGEEHSHPGKVSGLAPAASRDAPENGSIAGRVCKGLPRRHELTILGRHLEDTVR